MTGSIHTYTYFKKQKENEDNCGRRWVDGASFPVTMNAADEVVDAKKEAENENIDDEAWGVAANLCQEISPM